MRLPEERWLTYMRKKRFTAGYCQHSPPIRFFTAKKCKSRGLFREPSLVYCTSDSSSTPATGSYRDGELRESALSGSTASAHASLMLDFLQTPDIISVRSLSRQSVGGGRTRPGSRVVPVGHPGFRVPPIGRPRLFHTCSRAVPALVCLPQVTPQVAVTDRSKELDR